MGGASGTGGTDVERARRLVELRRLADARDHLGRVLATDPTSAEALALLAYCELEQGDATAALLATAAALQSAPDDEWVHRLRSSALVDLGRNGDAVASARAAVAIAPDLPATHQCLAIALSVMQGQHHAARAAAQRALELAPDDPEAHNIVGVVEMHLDNLGAARAAFRRALTIAPNHPGVLKNFAALELRVQRLGPAATLLSSALATGGQDPRAVANLDAVLAWRVRWITLLQLMAIVLLALMASDDEKGIGQTPAGTRAVAGLVMAGICALFAWFSTSRLRRTVRLDLRGIYRRLLHQQRALALVFAACPAILLATALLPDPLAETIGLLSLVLWLPLVPALLGVVGDNMAAANNRGSLYQQWKDRRRAR